MHAWTAWRLGDDTARHLGRITLNPAVHFDPLGFFVFVLIAFGFGVHRLGQAGAGQPEPAASARHRLGTQGRAWPWSPSPARSRTSCWPPSPPFRSGWPTRRGSTLRRTRIVYLMRLRHVNIAARRLQHDPDPAARRLEDPDRASCPTSGTRSWRRWSATGSSSSWRDLYRRQLRGQRAGSDDRAGL